MRYASERASRACGSRPGREAPPANAGKTWVGIRGAPGGDDYQHLWINPNNTKIILAASDQGAIVTVNGGETWSSWYNQPTAQMYHVAADNAFPYRLCSGQQESGSACVSSRGNDGSIAMREWHPAGVEEYGYAAPDPLDPDLVYGGKVTRYDRRTGQVKNVSPKPERTADFRTLRTAPVLFSPADPHTMYFAGNIVWKTTNGGRTWTQISPDLARKTWEIPASIGKYRDTDTAKPTQRGVIYTVAPSPKDIQRIWAGTDDGMIHVTVDGGLHWKDVTPPQLVPWSKVSIIDAGHFDTATAYAAVNTLRLDDMRPHLFRTHEAGKTWTEIVHGIPDGAPVNVIREDPKRKGLLFAGTEREVYVSFDDGNQWQSLRLNMPATSIRDLIVKDDDLAVGTHSRGFWILDDITALRQLPQDTAKLEATLFAPQTAIRVRWDMNTDTPIPPDEPAGKNPPDGAILDYYLGAGESGPVTLEILDSTAKVVRRYSSEDRVRMLQTDVLPIPQYWVRSPSILSAAPGFHRWIWDLHYTPLPGDDSYSMQAIAYDTPVAISSVWAMPGRYTVKLTAGGKTLTRSLSVKMDPRVRTSTPDLMQQFTLSKQVYDDVLAASATLDQIQAARKQALAADVEKDAAALEGERAGRGGRGAPPPTDSFNSVSGTLSQLLRLMQDSDDAPTAAVMAAVKERRAALAKLNVKWTELQKRLQP